MTTPEHTPAERKAVRELVARSNLLADTSAERHGVYAVRKPPVVPVPPVVVNVGAHVFVVPVVFENPWPL